MCCSIKNKLPSYGFMNLVTCPTIIPYTYISITIIVVLCSADPEFQREAGMRLIAIGLNSRIYPEKQKHYVQKSLV